MIVFIRADFTFYLASEEEGGADFCRERISDAQIFCIGVDFALELGEDLRERIFVGIGFETKCNATEE
jgi:hypothetical protein